jgi:hypothetical protein
VVLLTSKASCWCSKHCPCLLTNQSINHSSLQAVKLAAEEVVALTGTVTNGGCPSCGRPYCAA